MNKLLIVKVILLSALGTLGLALYKYDNFNFIGQTMLCIWIGIVSGAIGFQLFHDDYL